MLIIPPVQYLETLLQYNKYMGYRNGAFIMITSSIIGTRFFLYFHETGFAVQHALCVL